MSLQVWLPLNGNLNNQGLSDITITGTPAYGNGKIGKNALDLINSQQIKITCPNLNNVSKFSICFWIIGTKDTNDVDWSSPINFSANKSGGTENTSFRFGKDNRASVDGYPICMFNNSSYPIATSNSLTFASASDWGKWIHVCMTTDGVNLKSYVNGDLKTSATNGTNGFLTGTINLRAARYNGFLNDFRIYDHCLSQKEIKEISKGLVLHYKLSNEGLGENLAHNTYNLSPSVTQQVEYKAYNIGVLDVTNGETVTVSFDLDMTVATGGSGYLLVYNTNEKGPHQISGKNSLEGRTLVVGEDLHERLSVTTTISNRSSSEIKKDNDFVEFYSNYSTENEIHISNIKVERGTIATPWLPNPSDTEYAFLDYNDTAEYDHSGFGNDGTKTNITTDLDTPRYSTSYFFDGDTSVITVPYDATAWQTNFTLNLWFKKHELGSKNYETLFGGPSGFEMDTRANNATTLSLYMASTRGGNVYLPFNFDEWYMVTLVNDGTNELYYINGELVKTIEKKAMPTGNYFLGAWQTATKQNFKGWMSDFRIYATPLSEKDIKELYTVGTAFDKQGRVMTYEVVEV